MNDHSYSESAIKNTLKRIRGQLNGNGVDPAAATLTLKRNGMAHLKARTSFEADAKVETKQEKGKTVKGRLVDPAKMDTEIKNFVSSVADQDSLQKAAKDKIKALPLQGFGSMKAVLDLPVGQDILCAHNKCQDCHGQGITQCRHCQGQANLKCPKCYGHGELQCDICLGHGTLQDGQTKKQCYKCFGRGEYQCYQCQGKRLIPCSQCQAKGQVTCNSCNGAGVNTMIVTLTPQIKTSAEIFVEDLDEDPKRMVGKIGSVKLAQGGHMDVKTVKPPTDNPDEEERAYFEDAPPDLSKTTVFYEATMPWAVAELAYGDERHDITFAGKKGAVCESGTFMEHILQPHLEMYDRALRKQASAPRVIKDSASLRVSRETFSLLGKGKPKKVMIALHKNYPYGWSKGFIQTYVTCAYKAMNKATRASRYLGLGLGLAASALLQYMMFTGHITLPPLFPENIAYLMLGFPLVLGALLSIIAVKATGFFQYYNLMRTLGLKARRMPPSGKAGLYGLIGSVIIWGILFYGLYSGLY